MSSFPLFSFLLLFLDISVKFCAKNKILHSPFLVEIFPLCHLSSTLFLEFFFPFFVNSGIGYLTNSLVLCFYHGSTVLVNYLILFIVIIIIFLILGGKFQFG